MWDFEFHLKETTTARRPDLILEMETDKKICICDMACSQQNNIGAKSTEKLKKYGQLVFKAREQRLGCKIHVVLAIVGALDSDIKAPKVDLKKIFNNNKLLDEVVAMMQKTVLMDSESIIRRFMSVLIQEDNE